MVYLSSLCSSTPNRKIIDWDGILMLNSNKLDVTQTNKSRYVLLALLYLLFPFLSFRDLGGQHRCIFVLDGTIVCTKK